MTAKAPLVIVSGPSGVGKSTVIDRLLAAANPPLRLSVSATTRALRPGETDGVHYHFWPRARFEQELRCGSFLEHAEVFGNYYGTLRSEVEPYREGGVGVLLDIDVQGASQVRRKCPDAVSVFLRAPSVEAYEQRLRQRGTESEAALQRRLQGARRELEHAGEYDYQVINDDLEAAVADVRAIIHRSYEGDCHAG
jgi:guanylate kinase